MANIKGQGRPTIYTKANKGDIYTDTNTGIKYECLGPDGFVEAGDIEKNKYDWKEIKTSGGGTGGVSSWNDLTDKPFGETILGERRVCIEPQTLNFVQATDMSDNPFPWTSHYFTDDGGLGQAAQTGAAAIVVIDGVEYMFEGEGSNGVVTYFGNKSIQDDTFVEALYPDAKILILLGGMGGNFILYLDSSFIGEHEVAVYAVKSDVTKLDEKFLPEHLQFNEESTPMYLCNEQFVEILMNSDPGGTYYYASWDSVGEFGSFLDGEAVWNVKDGDIITVVIDGAVYETVATIDENKQLTFGDRNYATIPFFFSCNIYGEYQYRAGLSTSSENYGRTYTISVYHNDTKKTIDPKFLPEHTHVSGVMIVTKEFNSNVLSHSYQEILDALTTRFVVLVSYDNADYPYMQYFSHSDFGDLVFTTYRPYVYDHIADYSTINVWTTVITSENEVYSSSGVINGGTPPNPA